MKKLKNLLKNKYFKIMILIILSLFILRESYKIYIDMYNFKQLERVKTILDELPKDSYSFKNIKKFNDSFNQGIQPIQNCYFLIDRNRFVYKNAWSWWYVFWFKFKSIIYKLKYKADNYSYPEYNLPILPFCDDSCYDTFKSKFEHTLYSPCKY